MKSAYDIFISYRRKDAQGSDKGVHIARTIKQYLEIKGYKGRVFFDYSELSNEDFDKRILSVIRQAKVFISVLTPDSMLRCVNDGDWVRRELLEAYNNKLQMIFINPDGREIAFSGGFPEELSFVKTRNHLTVHMDSSFERDMDDLIEKHIAPVSAPSDGSNSGKYAKVRVRTDHDCIIKRFDEEIGSAKVGEYSIVYLPKGKHRITFISSARREVMLEVTHEVTDLEYEGLMEVKLEDVYRKFVEDEEKKHKREQFRGVLKKSWIWIGIVMVFAVVAGVFIGDADTLTKPEPKDIIIDTLEKKEILQEKEDVKANSNVNDESSKEQTSFKIDEQVIEEETDSAQVRFSVGGNAVIYIDGVKKAVSSWSGKLEQGKYHIECSKENQNTTSKYLTFAAGQVYDIQLDTPKAKVGSIVVESKPSGASVKIDGKDYGLTPLTLDNLLAGYHTVEISKSSYEKYSKKVYVREGEAVKENVVLTAVKTQSSPASSSSKSGTINGHEYVDLGLPSGLKWATCNVGASSQEEYGDYYAWGEIETKSKYDESNSKTYGKSMSDISGNSIYDVARAKWGGNWRMPTTEELEELNSKCTWQWTTQKGINGYKVTGPNGNSIFLPAAGVRRGSSLKSAGEFGSYWSSTPYERDDSDACCLSFVDFCLAVGWNDPRYRGQSVRPVSE